MEPFVADLDVYADEDKTVLALELAGDGRVLIVHEGGQLELVDADRLHVQRPNGQHPLGPGNYHFFRVPSGR